MRHYIVNSTILKYLNKKALYLQNSLVGHYTVMLIVLNGYKRKEMILNHNNINMLI